MHIVILFLAAGGGALFWFYRLRMMGSTARDALNAAQSAKGDVSRLRNAARSDFAPIAAIDAAPVAAATWMRLQMDLIEWEDRRAQAFGFLERAAGARAAEEAVVYAEWASGQDLDPARAVRTLRAKLEEWLTPDELAALDQLFVGAV